MLTEFPLSHLSSSPAAFGTITSDFTPVNGLNNCLYLKAATLASKYVRVYEFEFSDPPPPVTRDPGFEMGAVHSSELPYQFPNFSNTNKMDGPDLSPRAQKLSDEMITAWSRFAWTEVPKTMICRWAPFESSTHIMRFEQGKLGYFDANAEHHCSFWQKLCPHAAPATSASAVFVCSMHSFSRAATPVRSLYEDSLSPHIPNILLTVCSRMVLGDAVFRSALINLVRSA